MTQGLPVLSANEVMRLLVRAGFVISRTSGSHCRLIYAGDPTRKVTVPLHKGDLKRGTLRSIIAQAGFTVQEFVDLL